MESESHKEQDKPSTHEWLCSFISTVMDEDEPMDIPRDPSTPIASLVLDSLGIIVTVEAIEEHFQISVADEDLDQFVTTGDISTYIDSKIDKKL